MNGRSPERTRILMLLHGYFPDEPRVAAEARAAVDAGFEVDIVTLGRPGEEPEAVVEGVRCLRIPIAHVRGGGLLSTMREYTGFTIRATAKAASLTRRRRYRIVQVHNPPDFLILAAVVPRLRGARIVLDVHDLSSDMFMMRFEGRPGARVVDRVLRLVERVAGMLSAAVLTVHDPYRRELVARGVPEESITVVMNSLDERLLPAAPRESERGSFRVVYHGTITPHYGVGLIVEAAGLLRDRVPGLRVEIYGEGDAVPELERRAHELGVSDVVHISTTYLQQADVLAAVQGASVGVVPNLPTRLNRFALSTKLLEYVALGIPVVSADLPTIREHFSDEEIRFFRAGNAVSLADALAAVAGDSKDAARHAAAARERYERYRWRHSSEAYVRLLRELSAGHTSSR